MARAFVPHVITNDSALGGSIIEKSLRFHGTRYLKRTSSSASNTFTYSAWIKRCKFSGYQYIFTIGGKGFAFHTSNHHFYLYDGSGLNESTASFRDPSAWYHIVVQVNSGTATSYINNVLVHNAVGSGAFTITSGSNETRIGSYTDSDYPFQGYMAEINLVDGSVVAPTSFGFTDSQTGIWMPKRYTGSYGTNGFYLKFNDNSSTSALGLDSSGNGNNFSASNFSLSTNPWHMNDAGSAHSDFYSDSPTNNFCTLNPIDKDSNIADPTEGNIRAATNSNDWCGIKGTMAVSSGKWYYEFKSSNNNIFVGWCSDDLDTTNGAPQDNNTLMSAGSLVFCDNGKYHLDTGGSENRVNYSTSIGSAVLGCAIDLDNNTAQFYKNNTALGVINISSSKLATKFVHPYLILYNSGGTHRMNFGASPFVYTPPAGYKAWSTNNMVNLHTPIILKPQKHFDVIQYTGNNSTNNITGLEFKPGMIMVKSKGQNYPPYIFDILRTGGSGQLVNMRPDSNTTEPADGTSIVSVSDGGFSLSGSSGINDPGSGTNGVVAWCWKAGGAAVTNNDGTIQTSISANQEAGFSVITFSGNGSAGSTIGHGLGRKPKFIIVKRRTGGAQDWFIRLGSFDSDYNGRYIRLNIQSGASGTDTNVFPNTEPTSTVISLGADAGVNASGSTYLCYCWAEIPGYSKFHVYKGNGSTEGPYVHLGFRPKMFIFKRLGGNSGFNIVDTTRSPINPNGVRIELNTNAAQDSHSDYNIDILNDGIKVRNSNGEWNAGERYAIMAWAEQPGTNPYGTETNAR